MKEEKHRDDVTEEDGRDRLRWRQMIICVNPKGFN